MSNYLATLLIGKTCFRERMIFHQRVEFISLSKIIVGRQRDLSLLTFSSLPVIVLVWQSMW